MEKPTPYAIESAGISGLRTSIPPGGTEMSPRPSVQRILCPQHSFAPVGGRVFEMRQFLTQHRRLVRRQHNRHGANYGTLPGPKGQADFQSAAPTAIIACPLWEIRKRSSGTETSPS